MSSTRITPFVSGPRSRLWLVLRFALGLFVLVALVALLVRIARPELKQLATWFVERFGAVGVGFGTLIADGFHFPIPPQAYMLLSIAAGAPAAVTLAATTSGSLIGGALGFMIARRLGSIPKVAHFIERKSGRIGRKLGHDYAYHSVVLLSITPVAFSVLCYLAGLYRMQHRPFLVLLALRIPKLVLYYYTLRLSWSFF